MELSLNYSKEAAELLERERVTFDRWKLPDWRDLVAELKPSGKPMYVHFGLQVGGKLENPISLDEVAHLVEETQTPFVNCHLTTRQSDFPEMPIDATGSQWGGMILERAMRDIEPIVARFGAEKVIVENIPWRADADVFVRACTDPEVMHQLLEKTGCGFLLDLSHARLTAHYAGINARAYVESLPVAKLRELHVTGLAIVEGKWLDHMPLMDEDWAETGWALEHIAEGKWSKPWTVALEYGGIGGPFKWRSDAAVIENDVKQLHQLMEVRG